MAASPLPTPKGPGSQFIQNSPLDLVIQGSENFTNLELLILVLSNKAPSVGYEIKQVGL